MGLDIYVGSFTRYCIGNWETIVQRISREQGIAFQTIRTNPDPPDKITDPIIVSGAVENWRKCLETGLKAHLPSGLSWDERADAPYFTDKPAWDGYSGVVLLAAHTEHAGIPRPEKVTSQWDKDEAFLASTAANFKSRFSQLFNTEIWLPCDFTFTFKTADVVGNQVQFGLSVTLLSQLRRLNDENYQANTSALSDWKREGTSAKGSFDQSARFGLALFLHLAEMSVQHRLPMKLDY